MTKDEAVQLIWEYMRLGHTLQKADVLFLLGSNDARVAEYAAKLFHEDWAPYLAISGDGTKHEDPLLRDAHDGKTEAEHFAEIVKKAGVPEDKLIIESTANNSEENFKRTRPLIEEKGIELDTTIIVQKPYMERRAYASGKVFWPDVDFILTSPPGSFEEYVEGTFEPDTIINIMVGDLERVKVYPKLGFQIPQEVPDDVLEAFELLVREGYNKRLIGIKE